MPIRKLAFVFNILCKALSLNSKPWLANDDPIFPIYDRQNKDVMHFFGIQPDT